MSTEIDVNRDVRLRSNVQVDGPCTLSGALTLPNSETWPTTAGTTSQVLALTATGAMEWTTSSAVAASADYVRTTVTGDHTISPAASTVFVNSATSVTITLPTIATAGDVIYRVIDIGGSLSASNTITIATQGGETIIGAASFVISAPYNAIQILHDGTSKWSIL